MSMTYRFVFDSGVVEIRVLGHESWTNQMWDATAVDQLAEIVKNINDFSIEDVFETDEPYNFANVGAVNE